MYDYMLMGLFTDKLQRLQYEYWNTGDKGFQSSSLQLQIIGCWYMTFAINFLQCIMEIR